MNVNLQPGPRTGTVLPPASKSAAHRLLILAALGSAEVRLACDGRSADIDATARCLSALGAQIAPTPEELRVSPVPAEPAAETEPAILPCGESGSTLRFLLPVAAALGRQSVFRMEGRLSERPLGPLLEELAAHGAVTVQKGARLTLSGRLRPGDFTLPGDISSQFISGLLLALPLLPVDSRLTVTGRIESEGYIRMTESALEQAGIRLEKEGQTWRIPGGQRPALPARVRVERDWSGAAAFLCLGALSPEGIRVRGLSAVTDQGDAGILTILRDFGAELGFSETDVLVRRGRLIGQTIDASMIPDLVPVLAALGAAAEGETRITGAARLRFKETDRLRTTAAVLTALGADVTETEDGLILRGKKELTGGKTPAYADHRIAMAAAVAAAACRAPVRISGAECVQKSYPAFWQDLEGLEVTP